MKKLQDADVLPFRATVLLKGIGQRIALARRARYWTQADLAAKTGMSINTLVGIEKGRPNVAIGLVVKALWAVDMLESLGDVASLEEDDITMHAAIKHVPQRVRQGKSED